MSLWFTRLVEIFPCCPIGRGRRKQSRAGIYLAPVEPDDPTIEDITNTSVPYVLFHKHIDKETPELDAAQLQTLLNSPHCCKDYLHTDFPFDGFSEDVCRAMVASRDEDHSGRLGYDELASLLSDIQQWLEIFKEHDDQRVGYLNQQQLGTVFESLDLGISEETTRILTLRYWNKNKEICFSDFVALAMRLKLMVDTWKERSNPTKKAAFCNDEFIQLAMYG